MIRKKTIKNFLKPTKAKVGLLILIFMISVILSHTIFFPPNNKGFDSFSFEMKAFYCVSIPGGCLLYSTLNFLNVPYDSEEAEDIFSILLFLALPLQIIYHYFLSCVLVFILKIKRDKKRNIP